MSLSNTVTPWRACRLGAGEDFVSRGRWVTRDALASVRLRVATRGLSVLDDERWCVRVATERALEEFVSVSRWAWASERCVAKASLSVDESSGVRLVVKLDGASRADDECPRVREFRELELRSGTFEVSVSDDMQFFVCMVGDGASVSIAKHSRVRGAACERLGVRMVTEGFAVSVGKRCRVRVATRERLVVRAGTRARGSSVLRARVAVRAGTRGSSVSGDARERVRRTRRHENSGMAMS